MYRATYTAVNICTVYNMFNECYEAIQIVINAISQHDCCCMEIIQ